MWHALSFRALAIRFMAIKADNLRAYIDASGVKPGQNNVTIGFTPPAG